MAILPDAFHAIGHGLADFLPLGARTHLGLAEQAIFGGPPEPLFQGYVHAGALIGLLLFCWRDVGKICIGIAHLARGKRSPAKQFLFLFLAASFPPVLVEIFSGQALRAMSDVMAIAGWTGIATAVLLFAGDRLGLTLRRIQHLSAGEAIALGVAWVLTLVPGAGQTLGSVALGRFLGYERVEVARFALLLAIPATATTVVQGAITWFDAGMAPPSIDALAGAAAALVGTLAAIGMMMQWLRRGSFAPFAAYQVLASGILLALSYRLA